MGCPIVPWFTHPLGMIALYRTASTDSPQSAYYITHYNMYSTDGQGYIIVFCLWGTFSPTGLTLLHRRNQYLQSPISPCGKRTSISWKTKLMDFCGKIRPDLSNSSWKLAVMTFSIAQKHAKCLEINLKTWIEGILFKNANK